MHISRQRCWPCRTGGPPQQFEHFERDNLRLVDQTERKMPGRAFGDPPHGIGMAVNSRGRSSAPISHTVLMQGSRPSGVGQLHSIV